MTMSAATLTTLTVAVLAAALASPRPSLAAVDPIGSLDDSGRYAPVLANATLRTQPETRVNLLIAVQKTTAPRETDTQETARKLRLGTVARLVWMRGREDANFLNKARNFARNLALRMDEDVWGARSRTVIAHATTGAEFLETLMLASQQGPIGNMVVYGHSAPTALYMREDRGFYRAVSDAAESSRLATSSETTKEAELRALGARDFGDLENLLRERDIRFAKDALVVFTGCESAGKTELEPAGIAARFAAIAGVETFGSIGSTDQSMAAGRRPLPQKEYTRGHWVRFVTGGEPQTLQAKVLDVLKKLEPEQGTRLIRPRWSRPASVPERPALLKLRCAGDDAHPCAVGAPQWEAGLGVSLKTSVSSSSTSPRRSGRAPGAIL
ncbi:MAG: hypothetical protein ACHQAY_15275 [Hyphomicrobiales bacterium]